MVALTASEVPLFYGVSPLNRSEQLASRRDSSLVLGPPLVLLLYFNNAYSETHA
jgi:hypothetical protein